jgi:hypothetical protein
MSLGRARVTLTVLAAGALTMTGCNLRLDQPKPRDPSAITDKLADAESRLASTARAQTTLLSDADFGPEWSMTDARGRKVHGVEPLTLMIDCIDGINPPSDPTAPTTTHANPPSSPARAGLVGFGISKLFKLDNNAYALSVSLETPFGQSTAELDRVLGPDGSLPACVGARLGSKSNVKRATASDPRVSRFSIDAKVPIRSEQVDVRAVVAVVHAGTSYVVMLNAQLAGDGYPEPSSLIDALSARVGAAQSSLTPPGAPAAVTTRTG